MNTQSVKKHVKTEPTKLQSLVKYPELSNSELEIICGGGNLIGSNRHHEEDPNKPKI